MKELLLGIALIILLGIGSFLYKNAVQKGPVSNAPVACTLDARICPDGSAVGRTGPACEFEACSTDAVHFSAPVGFTDTLPLLSSTKIGRIGFYTKDPSTISNIISISAFKLQEGEIAEDILFREVVLSPSDMRPESIDRFEALSMNGRTVYRILNERFEATVEITYGIPLDGYVVLVSLRDISVEKWMEDFTLDEMEDLKTVEDVVNSISL